MLKKTLIALILVIFCLPLTLYGQQNETVLKGKVIGQQTGKPLSYTNIFIKGLGIGTATNKGGYFEFTSIAPGTYTLHATRIGYRPITKKVTIGAGDTLFVKLKMIPAAVNLNELTVTAETPLTGSEIEGASEVMADSQFRKNLSTTLAATLQSLPGVSTRSLGAAPARPVIRGLGGKRVIILEDGFRAGGRSAYSVDHAVTIDPIGAEKIEIARGPAALKFGSNAIGGVINVVSHQIPASLPSHLQGTASLQGSTVNYGTAAALGLRIPVGNFAVQLNSSFRRAGNIHTPVGEITNTDILSTDNTLGISYIQPWGYVGVAGSFYLNHYGIPPDPHGGHKYGVNIKMRSYQFMGKTEILLGDDFFRVLSANFSYTNYYHTEIEPGGVTGTQYGQLTTTVDLSLRHGPLGFINEGTIGVWGEISNLAVKGSQTPTADSYSFAAYLIEEASFGSFDIKAGIRFDYVKRNPVVSDHTSRIGYIRPRTFTALSSSGSITYNFSDHFSAGIVLFHSFRAPTVVELYSLGPHLASYSYEVGNPNLDAERAWGKELFFEYSSSTFSAKISLYQNDFSNYIYPQNTGRTAITHPSLNVYKYTGTEAEFYGFEASIKWRFLDHFQASGSVSYVYARRKVDPDYQGEYGKWRPLPKIPPLKSNITLTYHNSGLEIGATSRIAASQTRTGIFETPTPGYVVFDLFGQYKFRTGHTLHTISLTVENVFNTVYRSHLSRIKEIMPEPGRNISLLYRIYF